MPSLAAIVNKVFLHQTLLYWPKISSDPTGKPKFDLTCEPTVLKCRWEDKQQEIILPDSRKVISKGYLLMIDLVKVGSMVYLGSLASWKLIQDDYGRLIYPNIPTVNQGGRDIILVSTTPGPTRFLAKTSIYEVYL